MKNSKTLGALACLVAGIGLSGCATTSAPKTSAEIFKDLRQEARAIALGRGYAGSHTFNGGMLEERQSGVLRFTLKAGERYVAIGLCDEQCKDIDLGVYDKNGFEIASDRQEDAIPIVELVPEKGGLAFFRMKMIRCDAEPCRYGVGVYRQ
ncbi:MAG: hypothetical protein AAGI28_12370 [Pseudomonadota bacterium]